MPTAYNLEVSSPGHRPAAGGARRTSSAGPGTRRRSRWRAPSAPRKRFRGFRARDRGRRRADRAAGRPAGDGPTGIARLPLEGHRLGAADAHPTDLIRDSGSGRGFLRSPPTPGGGPDRGRKRIRGSRPPRGTRRSRERRTSGRPKGPASGGQRQLFPFVEGVIRDGPSTRQQARLFADRRCGRPREGDRPVRSCSPRMEDAIQKAARSALRQRDGGGARRSTPKTGEIALSAPAARRRAGLRTDATDISLAGGAPQEPRRHDRRLHRRAAAEVGPLRLRPASPPSRPSR